MKIIRSQTKSLFTVCKCGQILYATFFFNYIDAVYSEDLTTHTDGTVTKIPYFTLMKRIFDERDDKQDLLSEQLEEVKRR